MSDEQSKAGKVVLSPIATASLADGILRASYRAARAVKLSADASLGAEVEFSASRRLMLKGGLLAAALGACPGGVREVLAQSTVAGSRPTPGGELSIVVGQPPAGFTPANPAGTQSTVQVQSPPPPNPPPNPPPPVRPTTPPVRPAPVRPTPTPVRPVPVRPAPTPVRPVPVRPAPTPVRPVPVAPPPPDPPPPDPPPERPVRPTPVPVRPPRRPPWNY